MVVAVVLLLSEKLGGRSLLQWVKEFRAAFLWPSQFYPGLDMRKLSTVAVVIVAILMALAVLASILDEATA